MAYSCIHSALVCSFPDCRHSEDMIVTPFAQVSKPKTFNLKVLFLLLMLFAHKSIFLKSNTTASSDDEIKWCRQSQLVCERCSETALRSGPGGWLCDRTKLPAGVAWLLRGTCVMLGLGLHSDRMVNWILPGGAVSDLHVSLCALHKGHSWTCDTLQAFSARWVSCQLLIEGQSI